MKTKTKFAAHLIYLATALLLLSACSGQGAAAEKTAEKSEAQQKIAKSYQHTKKQVSRLRDENDQTELALDELEADRESTEAHIDEITSHISQLNKTTPATSTTATSRPPATSTAKTAAAAQPKSASTNLANLNYTNSQEIPVNNNEPNFSAQELSTARGAWESYANLDSLNRAVDANALLSQKLMPTQKRTDLTWDPTGWKNKRTKHGWLYNRSHLIGFQLSGENNNPKNLITGTQSLNNPLMLSHEMDIATYIKASPAHYVRYEVKPIYRGNELVARGVQMRAQSIGDNQIHLNLYIFNVESGYRINYSDGSSVVE
ncbi:dna-entry nuclease [Lapidilactobacillus concavus DSM 17758]|uniref:Dna-entry nuclease n=1 Tax=Lapidilactobacillus concavus DSM 17758 TaxID=1423735 RepID=A0A0R1W4R5_9LACO|nr:DNA/RNA non-specific endonuclease [Lapidilactobacillus concavus]KRM10601.1 dna-entry nuclease [Lapidilactobacillus concavus DSM 17758]GEL12578.1 DNA-entry nuclease [Lapidilactobacillus concavus]